MTFPPDTFTAPDPITLADALRVAAQPDLDRWREQVRRTGGCADPIHLQGGTVTRDAVSGEVLHSYTTAEEPGGRLRIACGNRRASRCPSCAWTYAGDTYHLIRAGLVGGKGVPSSVHSHPMVFATLTAPSFGPVHNRPESGRCRCGTVHGEGAAELGTPLNPAEYDYAGAVLFNNHAGDLWRRFTIYLRREIAVRAGLSQSAVSDACRVSFGKVAEFQKRGAVHFHAIVRLDGPEGPGDAPPHWASVLLLSEAIPAAVARATVTVPAPEPVEEYGYPASLLAFGDQVDIRPIGGDDDGGELTEAAVAAYVAKYATKAAETTGTLDRRIGELAELDAWELPEHTRRLIVACKALDVAYPDRMLWRWAHMLGFRGHFSTKSRRYSTTLGALRQERADYRARQERRERGLPEPDDAEGSTLVIAHWAYAGRGHTPGESWLAQTIARDLRESRQATREALADLDDAGEGW